MKSIVSGLLLAVTAVALAGCAPTYGSNPRSATLNSAALGGLGGAAIGGLATGSTKGALVGGAVGATGGAIVGNQIDQQHRQY